MKKRLKLRAEYIGKGLAELTVVEQSHFKGEFGNDEIDSGVGGTAFVYGTVRILSVLGCAPEIAKSMHLLGYTGDKVQLRLWVADSRSMIGSTIVINAAYWPIIKEAVEAYNKFYER